VLGVAIGTVGDFFASSKRRQKHKKFESHLNAHTDAEEGKHGQTFKQQAEFKKSLLASLQKKYPGEPIDDYIMQKEMGEQCVLRFCQWVACLGDSRGSVTGWVG
jgi:hypothetical protein